MSLKIKIDSAGHPLVTHAKDLPVINVQPGTFGEHCRILGKRIACNRKPTFMVFGDDGRPYTSRLEGCVCAKHLPLAVRRVKKAQISSLVEVGEE